MSRCLIKFHRGLTLLEVLVALAIGSLIIVACVAILNHGNKVFTSIESALDENTLPREIFQMIIRDIDEVANPDSDATLQIETRSNKGAIETRLTIIGRIYDSKNKPIEMKKIVWQSRYDNEMRRITLYRARGGIDIADSILDTQAQENPNSLVFVPVTDELTYFEFSVLQGDSDDVTEWVKKELPTAIRISMSFESLQEEEASEEETAQDDSILSRVVVVDRTREIKFTVPVVTYEEKKTTDPNDVAKDENVDKKSDDNSDSKNSSETGVKK